MNGTSGRTKSKNGLCFRFWFFCLDLHVFEKNRVEKNVAEPTFLWIIIVIFNFSLFARWVKLLGTGSEAHEVTQKRLEFIFDCKNIVKSMFFFFFSVFCSTDRLFTKYFMLLICIVKIQLPIYLSYSMLWLFHLSVAAYKCCQSIIFY